MTGAFIRKGGGGDFPGGPVVKTLCFHCRWHGFEPGWGTKIPHAMQRGQKVKINLKLKNKKNIYI